MGRPAVRTHEFLTWGPPSPTVCPVGWTARKGGTSDGEREPRGGQEGEAG